jgi:hypothetical protein
MPISSVTWATDPETLGRVEIRQDHAQERPQASAAEACGQTRQAMVSINMVDQG